MSESREILFVEEWRCNRSYCMQSDVERKPELLGVGLLIYTMESRQSTVL